MVPCGTVLARKSLLCNELAFQHRTEGKRPSLLRCVSQPLAEHVRILRALHGTVQLSATLSPNYTAAWQGTVGRRNTSTTLFMSHVSSTVPDMRTGLLILAWCTRDVKPHMDRAQAERFRRGVALAWH